MKRMLKTALIVAAFAIMTLFTVTAHASDSIKFNVVQTYNGVTYTCADAHAAGEINADDVRPLPYGLANKGDIYRFAIYYDKIYYLTGEQGSDCVLGSIYRCNLDGSGNELIANDADALGNAYLSDGCLYYDILADYYNYYGRYLDGGIMKINLNTNSYGRIVTDSSAVLINILDDKLFYCVYTGDEWRGGFSYHLMSTGGAYIGGVLSSDIEVSSDFIAGATAYSGGYKGVYSEDWNRSTRWICNIPSYVNYYPVTSNYPYVTCVTGGYIYYNVAFMPDNYGPNVAMLRVPVSGGASELVAQWFVS